MPDPIAGEVVVTGGPADVLGWLSACVLIATMVAQIGRQWRKGTSRGVSAWLFVGQLCASLGLAVYSYLLDSMVFVALNVAMAGAALVGLSILRRHRQKEGSITRA